ncbi:hypothetical protein GDO81_007724 [Engystomops pustulosus]|uniref:Uncharacterized protein n=1 Tax=Engystomops pustulosus TaxID=76066 RepID=A0AAV7C971_ENGPU|nr:hypothetical protein GDO81_007724 [Engystomops pustulosus]
MAQDPWECTHDWNVMQTLLHAGYNRPGSSYSQWKSTSACIQYCAWGKDQKPLSPAAIGSSARRAFKKPVRPVMCVGGFI